MSGRSRQSLFNSAAALTVNVVGNLLLVPRLRHQRRRLRLGASHSSWPTGSPRSRPPAAWGSRRGRRRCSAPSGSPSPPWASPASAPASSSATPSSALVVATLVGGAAYSALTWRLRRSIHLQDLLDSFRREPAPSDRRPQPDLGDPDAPGTRVGLALRLHRDHRAPLAGRRRDRARLHGARRRSTRTRGARTTRATRRWSSGRSSRTRSRTTGSRTSAPTPRPRCSTRPSSPARSRSGSSSTRTPRTSSAA